MEGQHVCLGDIAQNITKMSFFFADFLRGAWGEFYK